MASQLTFLNFDLLIERTGDQYRARVIDSPAGQASAEFEQPFSELELENFFLRIGRPRQGVRRLDSPEMDAAKKFGARLFETVFDDEIYACLRTSLSEAQGQDKGVRLRIRVNAPELTDLPWEYLYNARLNRFLSLSLDTPIVRHLDLPHPSRPLTVQPPIKVLAMISSPSDYTALDVEGEWQKLEQSLGGLVRRGLVTLERLEKATLAALQRRLRRGEYHIFHFVGHGGFDVGTQDGVLLFENEAGRGRRLSGQYLGTLLHNHRPLRLVILNACEGARTSRNDPFAGVAQTLVQQGILAVIAMQNEITDRAAITFAHEFYTALADGYPVDSALTEARTAIFAQGNDIEWGTPVYFTRAPDGRVFNVDILAEKHETPSAPASDPRLEKRLEQLYDDGLSAYWLEDWPRAREHFQALVAHRPDYPDAAEKLAEVERQIDLAARYEQMQGQLQAGDWRGALVLLEQLAQDAPGYKDVADKLSEASQRVQLDDLYDEAARLHKAEEWQAVLNVFERIKTITPDFADPQKLLQTADAALAEHAKEERLNGLYRDALKALDAGRWQIALRWLQQVQAVSPGYRETAQLMARVEAEIVRGQQEKIQAETTDQHPPSRYAQPSPTQKPQTPTQMEKQPPAVSPPTRETQPRPLWLRLPRWAWLGGTGVIGIGLLLGIGWLANMMAGQFTGGQPTKAPTQMTAATDTPRPPTRTNTPGLAKPTEEALPPMITGNGHEMALVPAGSFEMGFDADDALAICQTLYGPFAGRECAHDFTEEEPVHRVFLDDYYMDLFEVTNAQYAACVADGACDQPSNPGASTPTSSYGDSQYDNYPVIYVSWVDADSYCRWRDARLPTEAEWEKAARGPDSLTYPWGNTFNGTRLNYCDVNCSFPHADRNFDDGYADTAPVGSYPDGKSPYGLYDMAGNVWEWVADWYDSNYYGTLEDGVENPTGPTSGDFRLVRGGSWRENGSGARAAGRSGLDPYYDFFDNLGFRCARSP